MEFDSQERSPIFYVILFGMLIFAIIFFANSVKKAVNSSKNKEAQKEKKVAVVEYIDINNWKSV